jgi:hypothetical protein
MFRSNERATHDEVTTSKELVLVSLRSLRRAHSTLRSGDEIGAGNARERKQTPGSSHLPSFFADARPTDYFTLERSGRRDDLAPSIPPSAPVTTISDEDTICDTIYHYCNLMIWRETSLHFCLFIAARPVFTIR